MRCCTPQKIAGLLTHSFARLDGLATEETGQFLWDLCERCCMINIEELSRIDSYAHSTLDVLKESARLCTLCRVFFRWVEDEPWEWALDRYKLRLSFGICKSTNRDFPAHSRLQFRSGTCILVRVLLEMRPSPFPLSRAGTETVECNMLESRMQCYTMEGDPATDTGIPRLRKNVGYTGSSSSLNVANERQKRCIAAELSFEGYSGPRHDDDCEDVGSPTTFPDDRPTRLLEILPPDDPDNQLDYSVKLIETNGLEFRYVALSYC